MRPYLKIRQISTKEKKLRFGLVSLTSETNCIDACFSRIRGQTKNYTCVVIFAATKKVSK